MSDSTTPEALAQRFDMKHIPKNTAVAKAAIEQALAPATEEPGEKEIDDPRLNREWPFDFSYKTPRGKLYVGKFVNQVLNLRQQGMVGVLRAKLAGGMPADTLDHRTAELNLMASHLAYSLKEGPDWSKDLLDLDDVELVGQLYDRAMEHEFFFRTGRPAPGPGQEGGK